MMEITHANEVTQPELIPQQTLLDTISTKMNHSHIVTIKYQTDHMTGSINHVGFNYE